MCTHKPLNVPWFSIRGRSSPRAWSGNILVGILLPRHARDQRGYFWSCDLAFGPGRRTLGWRDLGSGSGALSVEIQSDSVEIDSFHCRDCFGVFGGSGLAAAEVELASLKVVKHLEPRKFVSGREG